MKTDEEIAREQADIAAVLGPTHAEWYAEACRMEIGFEANHQAILWACRVRMMALVVARDMKRVCEAARILQAACARLEGCGGDRVRTAMDAVDAAIWWEEPG